MKKVLWSSIVVLLVVIGTIFILTSRKDVVVIAVFGDYTNGDMSFAMFGYQGIELAVEELNESQDEIEYVLEQLDTQVYETKEKLNQRLDDIDADIIYGPFLSSTLTAYEEFITESTRPVFVVSATHDNITGIDDTVFRLMNATSIQGQQTAEAMNEIGYERVYMLYDSVNQGYTKEIVDYMALEFTNYNIDFTSHMMETATEDLTQEITSDYDAIFVCGQGDKSAERINTLREDSINQPIITCSFTDNTIFLTTIDYDIEDVYLYTNRNIQYDSAYDGFTSRFLARYNTQPSIPGILGYEIQYFFHHMYYVQGISVNDMNTYVKSLNDYTGMFYTYHQLNNGDFYTIMGFYEVDNQEFNKINRTQIN